ncbi:MAG: urea amidolyase associated protein UAAP1 [Pseudomonadota bacterium]
MPDTTPPPALSPPVLTETLPAGCHHSLLLRRGYTLRLVDVQGDANVALIAVNHDEKSERYNMADTLKAQHVSRLGSPLVLYSDMGRVLLSIPYDNFGQHDAFCGTTNAALITAQYGEADFQTVRNDYFRNGRDGLLMELGRWGLSRRDLVPNINLFTRILTDEAGNTTFDPESQQPQATVDLRAEMNCLVVLSTAPHPLAPYETYPSGSVALSVHWTGPAGPDDPCRHSRPENVRGYENTEAWFAQTPQGPQA